LFNYRKILPKNRKEFTLRGKELGVESDEWLPELVEGSGGRIVTIFDDIGCILQAGVLRL
jgi:hypothetical protein